jgi:hypothetical protein
VAEPVAQYLTRHARAESSIADALDGGWDHAVVIPAMAESPELFAGLDALGERPTLVILVINQTAGASPDDDAANRALLEAARGLGESRRCASALPAYEVAAPRFDLLVVDRASPGNELPDRQGVGLARRIGMDIALALHDAGKLARRWLHTTDADVVLPAGYLGAGDELDGAVALAYPYWHVAGELTGRHAIALGLYEISMRYYTLGTRWATVPSFPAIGSTVAVAARPYAEVRGVPLRQAGEDFYLLSKLDRLGDIRRPRCSPIEIRGRARARAPFGTAPASARITARLEAGERFALYAPESFAAVASVRRGLDALIEGAPVELEANAAAAFAAVGGAALVARIAVIDRIDVRRREVDQWLDALKVLRLIHELRCRGNPDVDWREALERAPFVPAVPGEDLETTRRAMAAAEDALFA